MPRRALPLPPGEDLPAFRRALLAWHRRNGLSAPWRESGDPYHVLVAAVMAQQTQMSRVLPKYDQFLRAFPTVDSLARASAARVLRAWEGMGYNMRALRLQRAARRIVREGGFARKRTELEKIEGIGPFTAAIVSSFAFGEPAAAIDTNVVRVVRRLAGDIDSRAPTRELRPAAERLLSRRAPARWNQAMMDLGAAVCTARAPKCGSCPVARWCRARKHMARRIGEGRTAYGSGRLKPVPRKKEEPFTGSRRYYRGRIVQALRELPAGKSMTRAQLSTRLGVNGEAFSSLIDALSRDGLVRVGKDRRLRLP
ncbi:MAG: A/G-specific adenine glycosylase [Dehalococcoidia bacterium]